MPIQSDDLGIYKSAVMADVPEGGGGATGTAVVDGVSNNIFPDVSDDNRAGGAFHLRKAFGLARTDDQDMLLGAGWAVLKPPADPAVDVTLFETPGWFDERTAAVTLVESTLVKGPRLLCRVQDMHYAGVSVLQLYNIGAATDFPAAGESIILRNPGGQEMKVRCLGVTYSSIEITDTIGTYTINIATCELNRALQFDVLGAPVGRIPPSDLAAATVFSTAPAAGANFHGVKPLASAVVLGAQPIRQVTVSGGIFAQLVPASTNPRALADEFPLVQRPTLSRTAQSAVSLTLAGMVLGPNAVIKLPTAIEPGSLSLTHGATTFAVNASGQLLQGSLVVGSVQYIDRTITMLGTAPNYGAAQTTVSFKPATVAGATAHSAALEVTDANQSRVIPVALEPAPAPGTLTLSYMSQNRWYDLAEDGTGKLAGSDSRYGAGTVSFVTGSLTASLGAMPDVGSSLILSWGDANSAVQATTGLPDRAWADLPLPEQPTAGTLTLAWSRAAVNYTATVAANGAVTGPAQVKKPLRQADGTYLLPFSPDTLPDGLVTVSYQSVGEEGAFTNGGSGIYTLTGAPIKPGSVRFDLFAVVSGVPQILKCYSEGTNVYADGIGLIGTINNTTGVMQISVPTINKTVVKTVQVRGYVTKTTG